MTISIITLWLSIILFYCAIGTWKLFEKAGRKQWEGLVPVYNIFIWTKIINKPWWWGLILLVPGWNQLLMLGAMNVSMGRIFGRFSAKDTIMQIVVPFVYFPMLAYDETAVYEGETDWNDKKQIERRTVSDHIALFFASFGIINALVVVLKATGTKNKPGQKSVVKEWGDSIVFALIAASMIRGYVLEAFTIPTPSMEKEMLVGDFLFVNKFAYGSRVPLTPISFPLAHNTIPFTYVNSYSTAIKLPYYRLPGFGKVKRNDIVVFNYPAGDTTVFGRMPGEKGAGGELQGHSYHQFVRQEAWHIAIVEEKKSLQYFFNNREEYENRARKRILVDNWKHHQDEYGRWKKINLSGNTYRPIDKRENYVKRCVAAPGDTLRMIDGRPYINSSYNKVGENVNFISLVYFNAYPTQEQLNQFKDNYGFNLGQYNDVQIPKNQSISNGYIVAYVNMSDKIKAKFLMDINNGKYGALRVIKHEKNLSNQSDDLNSVKYSYINVYPNHPKFNWTVDNYGPLWMPKEGATIPLNEDNWIKYSRCINTYENNNVSWKDGAAYQDGKVLKEYTFKQNYYYMVGDNRHKSADSRMWGFVPEDHVVGKAMVVFMSKDQEKGWFDGGIRWNRIFKTF